MTVTFQEHGDGLPPAATLFCSSFPPGSSNDWLKSRGGGSRTWSFWLVAGFLYRAPFTRGCPRASWEPCCSLSSLSLHRSSSAPLSEGSPCLPLLPPTHSYLGRSCNSWLCLAFAPQKTWSDTSVSWLLTLMFLPAPILLPL